jgi:hypothetical protein
MLQNLEIRGVVVSHTIAHHLCTWSLIISSRKGVSIVEMAGRLETVPALLLSSHTQPLVVFDNQD